MRHNLVGIEDLRHIGDLDQGLASICHEAFASIS
jgi:hypothetical protein